MNTELQSDQDDWMIDDDASDQPLLADARPWRVLDDDPCVRQGRIWGGAYGMRWLLQLLWSVVPLPPPPPGPIGIPRVIFLMSPCSTS